jgi:hypothetical protein
MSKFSGRGSNGQLSLNDSILEFEDWQIQGDIFGPNEPGLNELYGSFEIHMCNIAKIHPLIGEGTKAEFYGNRSYQAYLIIDDLEYGPDPINVSFRVTGELKEFP